MTTYTFFISDGMTRNAGGEYTYDAETLGEAKQGWRDWAENGSYTSCDGTPVTVEGSIWVDDECVARMQALCQAVRE